MREASGIIALTERLRQTGVTISDYTCAQSSAGFAHDRRLIVPRRRVERHVEAVPTIDRDNRKGKLRQFSLAELLTCRVVDHLRNAKAGLGRSSDWRSDRPPSSG